MRRVVGAFVGTVAVAVTLILGNSSSAIAQTPELNTDAATLAAVADYVDEQRTRLGVPGMAVAIVVDDEVVLLEGFGEASDGTPVTGDTAFLINSMSKSITALALMQLVDAEAVNLDAPVSTYIHELGQGGEDVTVRDVMHHRSGLDEAILPEASETDLEANMESFRLGLRPDAGFEYSNANYDILALIVERVSGIPFADYVEENVFAPLDMEQSAVSSDRAQAPDPTGGHYPWLLFGYRPLDVSVDYGQVGSAAMYSTAGNMAHYLAAHLNDGEYQGCRLVSEAGLAVLHEARPYGDDVVLGYGGGLFVEPANSFDTPAAMAAYPTVWHDGASSTFRSVMWMTLGPNVGMVLLANGNDVTQEGWLGQISYGSRLILSGEEAIDVTNQSDFLTRWSKSLYLGLALIQVVMVVLVLRGLPELRRVRHPKTSGWIVLGAATIIDIGAAILVFIVTPAVAEAPLSVVMRFPDYRILISVIVVLIGWGVVRTVLVSWWLLRPRQAVSAPSAAAID